MASIIINKHPCLQISLWLTALIIIASCSAAPKTQETNTQDPYEHANRKVFAFNMGFDTRVIEPIAKSYKSNVSENSRRAINNHLNWASLPSTALNSSLQGRFENAALATIHFAINGLAFGFADLTEEPKAIKKSDFGQTLAFAKIPEGDYLMVPFFGPHSSRNLAGRVIDTMTNPLSMFEAGGAGSTLRAAQVPTRIITFRSNNFDAINNVKYNSADAYARTRSLYYQVRDARIIDAQRSSKTKTVNDNQFDLFFDGPQE